MEKHWKSVIPRTVCDYFFEAQRQVHFTATLIIPTESQTQFCFF